MTTHDKAEQLASYRKTIDNLDSALLHILAERFRCNEQVGHMKAEQALRQPTVSGSDAKWIDHGLSPMKSA